MLSLSQSPGAGGGFRHAGSGLANWVLGGESSPGVVSGSALSCCVTLNCF